ncbi:LysM peptidoglycan-binding domain-containing protein [Guyparkeria hydrothermalis]|uniref:lytic transglycosylase n=1 Tax=Guyparkeria hydrothermalis TaxID=923 RepID=UPI00202048B8|nr:LysM peptidoglycan-binding domain-containing protein [Guyparkeria hydrothermalis]MCL7743457.1 LysM peptidoglycan-binding domain-containing protein [Guyparkeria hydrothermalis]
MHHLFRSLHTTLPRPSRPGWTRGLALSLAVLLLHGCSSLVPPDSRTAGQDRTTQPDYSPLPAISRPESDSHLAADHEHDLWRAVATRFTLPVPDNARVDAELRRYARHPDYLRKVSERAEPYLYMIVEKLEAANLPLELTLLPIVESAYLPQALSSSSAAGIWQFIPSTGTYFGLERDTFYDGRRDIEASTDAAVTYFSQLRGMFDDDWPTVIAAYNGGQGTLLNAIRENQRRGRSTDFWSLKQLRKETRDYPARFFALVKIFSNPKKYGFNPHPIENRPALAQIELDKSVNLVELANLTGMDHKALYRLNPGFGRSITGDKPRQLLVPHEARGRFDVETLTSAASAAEDWQRYTFERGDSFYRVARRYGSSVDELLAINRRQSALARPGEVILVPAGRVDQAIASGNAQTYTVRPGDSLWAISRKHDIKLAELRRMNHYGDNPVLRPGDKVVVGVKSKTAPDGGSKYVVQPGDTLWQLARRFSMTVDELTNLNQIGRNATLKPGQELVVASN